MYTATIYPNGAASVWRAYAARFAASSDRAAKALATDIAAQHTLRAEVVLSRHDGDALVARWHGHNAAGDGWEWRDTTPERARGRGVCPECGGSHPLTRRGTIAPHRRSDGRTVRDLRGTRRPALCVGAAHTPRSVA